MKAFSRFLSILLVLSLIPGCGASGSGAETDAEEETAVQTDSTEGLFLSMTESTSKSLVFPLTKEQAARVEQAGADQVTWTLRRVEPYANPADGNFISLRGE